MYLEEEQMECVHLQSLFWIELIDDEDKERCNSCCNYQGMHQRG